MKLPTAPLFAFLITLAIAGAEPAKTITSEAAEAKAQKWLDGLGDKGLVLKESSDKVKLGGNYNAHAKSTSFQFNQPGWWLTLGIKGKVTKDTTLEQLRERINFLAINALPTPGLEVPGWEIKPRTPVSSFKEGVEIASLKDGVITLKVKTKFFALYGTDPQAMRLVPADAGAPKSAYFMIRKPFKLTLTLTAPFLPPAG